MTEFDDLVARLRALGSRPVDPTVASEHLTAMADVRSRAGSRATGRFGRMKIAAAFAAGIVLGGTSLASAGVMGSTVQDKVADAAAHVNVNLPGGTERYGVGAPECPGYTEGMNHGQWVKAHKGDAEAAKSDCGKPKHSVDKSQNDANENEPGDSGNGAACTPPWAGKGKAGKDIDKSAWRSTHPECADDQGDQGENSQENGTQDETSTTSVTPSTAAVTPPGGGQDDNAGVPNGGSIPGENEQGSDHRTDTTGAPSTLPAPAQGQGPDDADHGTTTTTALP